MSTIPQIQEITDLIIETLILDGFFVDYEITSQDYAKKRFSEELTNKFLINGLDEDGDYFSEEEYHKILNEIVAEDILRNLQSKGFLQSYEDETTEEVFFLTDSGKEKLKDLKLEDDDVIS
jgi:hypothetical protein